MKSRRSARLLRLGGDHAHDEGDAAADQHTQHLSRRKSAIHEYDAVRAESAQDAQRQSALAGTVVCQFVDHHRLAQHIVGHHGQRLGIMAGLLPRTSWQSELPRQRLRAPERQASSIDGDESMTVHQRHMADGGRPGSGSPRQRATSGAVHQPRLCTWPDTGRSDPARHPTPGCRRTRAADASGPSRPSISTTTRQRPRGRRGAVEQHNESTTAKRIADHYDDRSRPNRAGFVLSQMVR